MNLRKYLPAAALALLGVSAQAAVVVVTADITTTDTWLSTNEYVLQGSVANQGAIRVLPGATLTIQPGTVVRGQPKSAGAYDPGSLIVLRGGKLLANGNAANPIIFTTAATDNNADGQPDGFVRTGTPGFPGHTASADRYDAGDVFWDATPKTTPKNTGYTGLWGGLSILGSAPVNSAGTADAADPGSVNGTVTAATYSYSAAILEGYFSPEYEYGHDWLTSDTLPAGTGAYTKTGKIDVDDNSGELTYLSLRHGGAQLSADNEVNGLTLAGVGRGTKVDFIEVWGNDDDGVEVFGGTVNLKHIAIFATKDDGLDLDQGYQGQVQYVLVSGGSFMERLLELDGDDADEGAASKASKANFEPRGSYELRNLTLISLATQFQPTSGSSSAGEGMRIRRNSSTKIYNVIYKYGDTWGGSGALTNPNPRAWNSETTAWNVLGGQTRYGDGVTVPGVSTGAATVLVGTPLTTNPGFGSITSATLAAIPGDTLANLTYLTSLNPRPGNTGGSPAAYLGAVAVPAGNLGFFEQTSFRGAFSNVTSVPLWTNGWTAANKSGVIPTL